MRTAPHTPSWDWPAVDGAPGLGDADIHVWLVSLSGRREDHSAYLETLSDDEKERADRYKYGELRADFVVGRGMLRILLSEYAELDASDVVFAYGENGKPSMAPEDPQLNVQFNVSHSRGVALYAFSRNRAVGVDVESTGRGLDVDGIARRFFTKDERMALRDLEPGTKREAFFRIWTCKEACMKWSADGIKALRKYGISFTGDGDPFVSGPDDQPSLVQLRPGAGWVGAVAAAGPMLNPKCFVRS